MSSLERTLFRSTLIIIIIIFPKKGKKKTFNSDANEDLQKGIQNIVKISNSIVGVFNDLPADKALRTALITAIALFIEDYPHRFMEAPLL